MLTTIVEGYEFVLGIHLTSLTFRSNLRSKVMKPDVAIKWKYGITEKIDNNDFAKCIQLDKVIDHLKSL